MYGMGVDSICCRSPVVVLYVHTPRFIATHSHGGIPRIGEKFRKMQLTQVKDTIASYWLC